MKSWLYSRHTSSASVKKSSLDKNLVILDLVCGISGTWNAKESILFYLRITVIRLEVGKGKLLLPNTR